MHPRRRWSSSLLHLSLALGSTALALSACKPKEPANTPADAAAAAQQGVDGIIANSKLPPAVTTPITGDKMGVTIHRLANGLSVYISTDRQKPRFNAWIAVRTGSRNDPANSTGLAHYLEHMLFKGTDRLATTDAAAERPHLERIRELYGKLREAASDADRAAIVAELDKENLASGQYAVPNELSRTYGQLGITGLNAFTSDDRTVYICDVPSNRLAAWSTMEIERFTKPAWRQFFTEIEAVYEEKNLSLDSPWTRTNEAMMLALFPAHPYGTQPTIGTVEHLKVPAYQDMIDYFERWYVPNNMAVVLAGDIDPATALPALEKTLGQMTPKPLSEPEAAELRPLAGRVYKEVQVEDSQGVILAWHTVPTSHDDEPAIVVMDWLMDNATSGLLNTELELTQKVPDAGSYSGFENEAGYWVVQATARDDQSLEDVEAMLQGVVKKLKAGEFTQAEIDAIVVNQDVNEKRRLESNIGRVAKMTESFIARRSWADELRRDQRLREVKRDDVLRVANKYLGDSFVALYKKKGAQEIPKIEKPKITPIQVDASRQSAFAKEILAMQAPELEPAWLVEGKDYTHTPLPAGPMIAAVNKRNDLFSLEYSFDRGSRGERLLCHALDLLDQSGYGETSVEDLKRQLFALGTDVSFSCYAEGSGVTISGIDRNMEKSVELVRAWFTSPTLTQENLDKLTENAIAERKNQLDNSNFLGWAASSYAQRGKDSPNLQVPTNKQLQTAALKKLDQLVREFPNHQHRTLYFGPRTADAVKDIVAFGAKHKKVPPRAKVRYRSQKGARIYFLHRENAKASVGINLPLAPQANEARPLAQAYGEYLGGDMGSLIFQEIRETRGLAYSAWGFVNPGQLREDDWALIGGMGTQADKTPEALATFLELIRGRPLEASRFASAKTSIDQEYRSSRIDPRWIVSWVESWDLRGDTSDPRPWLRESIQKLEGAQLEPFMQRFDKAPIIISIVGNRDTIGLDAIKKIAPVTELKAEEIVGYGPFPKPKAQPKAAATDAKKAAPAAGAAKQ
ncbi:MAG: insulinase family protein [Myxococcales bacterium]|nr:insulinase family protein [Myxococcales bacterium]